MNCLITWFCNSSVIQKSVAKFYIGFFFTLIVTFLNSSVKFLTCIDMS